MSQKNILIAAGLTAFILVILAGLALNFRSNNPDGQDNKADLLQDTPTDAPTPVVTPVTHQEAAMIAANYLGQTDIYSVEMAEQNGTNVYKVVFSSGQIVYVSLDGQVLGSESPTPVAISIPATSIPGSIEPQPTQVSHKPGEHEEKEKEHENEEEED